MTTTDARKRHNPDLNLHLDPDATPTRMTEFFPPGGPREGDVVWVRYVRAADGDWTSPNGGCRTERGVLADLEYGHAYIESAPRESLADRWRAWLTQRAPIDLRRIDIVADLLASHGAELPEAGGSDE